MLYAILKELIDKELPLYSNLSTAASILYTMKDINWAGFYLLEDDTLYVGPYQGELACTTIKVGKGVCGTSVLKDETLIVPNVLEFKGHIACSSKSRSEIVVPIHSNKGIVGVIDIDSPVFDRFTDKDKEELEKIACLIGALFNE